MTRSRSAADAKQRANAEADDLIHKEEEQRRDGNHGEHQACGHQSLLAGRPGDTPHLDPHLAHELRRINRHPIHLRTACLKSHAPETPAPHTTHPRSSKPSTNSSANLANSTTLLI